MRNNRRPLLFMICFFVSVLLGALPMGCSDDEGASLADTSSTDTQGGDTATSSSSSGDTSSPDTRISDTSSPDTTPVDTTPVDTTPVDTTPVDTTPVDTTMDDTTMADMADTTDVGGCVDHSDCTDDAMPACDASTGQCGPPPQGHPIGWGDGSTGSVTLNKIFSPPSAREATDLEFDPLRPNELWVVYREYESTQPCTSTNQTFEGCTSLEGSVYILTDPGTPQATATFKMDENAWHFMRRPPSLAFGAADTFATCGEYITGNFPDDPAEFIGPTLWSSDPSIFAITPPGGNGSHLDMLHATPYCMGIAHESANIYWTFNGHIGAIDQYNFNDDHGPGNDDHADGEIYRYATGLVAREPGVPSHMMYHAADQHLYIADTGNGRIARLDTQSGTLGGSISPVYEPLAASRVMNGAVVTDVVAAGGVLDRPSGLAIHDGLLYVTDNATSQIHAFQLDGTLVRSLDTGLPEGSLAGFTIGPDEMAYFTDISNGDVYRIEP